MKNPFFIKDTLSTRITYYHLVVFAMALPFDRLYSELALISLAVHTLINITRNDISQIQWKYLFFPGALYMLTVLGTSYTHFYDEAFFEWERQLALLLFPLIVLCNSFEFTKHIIRVLFAMSVSCCLAVVYLYYNVYAIIRFNHLPLTSVFSNAFINHNFSAPIDMHATYFSMYILLAAVGLTCLLKGASGKLRILYIGMLLILFIGLIQLTSRAVFISAAVIVNIAIPFFMIDRKKRLFFCMSSLLITVSVLYAITRIDNLKSRFIIELKEDLTQAAINNNTLEPRAVRWECAWELIQRSPIYGYGSGSEIALLKEIYFRKKLYNSYVSELNAHNQYLSMLIKTGAIGLSVLLYILVTGFVSAIQKQDVAFASFLVIACVVSFSENILDANKGIFFFSFFYAVFYLGNKKKKFLLNQK